MQSLKFNKSLKLRASYFYDNYNDILYIPKILKIL